MNTKTVHRRFYLAWPLLALLALPVAGVAQVAVPEIEELDEIPTISASEIEDLVGPIALYPDDLLAIVLPASTYPLQIVEAGRFIEALEGDPSLEPDEDWDDSVVALLNYPEVVEMMNEDLDWTWRLGEAVVAQQTDVIAGIEAFRDQAYAAGNLESDDYQLVSHEGDTIQITPVQEDVIYVPYYEPEQVIVYQPRPVYYYYPRPYPVYYYPYPSYYSFHDHFHHSWFWGVTTAFTIGWHTHHLNVYHHTFYGHPYYGYSYWNNWWYRRPDIHIYNNTYVHNNGNVRYNRYRDGDRWAPSERRTVRSSDGRITRTRYYSGTRSQPSVNTNRHSYTNTDRSGPVARNTSRNRERDIGRIEERDPIQFRQRPSSTPSSASTRRSGRPDSNRNSAGSNVPRATYSSGTSRPTASRNTTHRKPEPRTVVPKSSSRRGYSSRESTPPPRSGASSRHSSKPSASSQRSSQQRSSQRSSQQRSSKATQSSKRSSRNSESQRSRRER
jgi:hypothetical protein